MAVNFSPIFNSQVFDENGNPASGWKIYSYIAGSSTPLATYTDSGGGTAQSNPIIINSLGFPTTGQIWLTAGSTYKLTLTDENDVVQKTEDNISGINDFVATGSEWLSSGLTPTYISATSFSVTGDQTGVLSVGRRLRTTNTGGTIYSTITASSFSSVTTVTVVNDSGSLDSGLSAVDYGLLQGVNKSVPPFASVVVLTSVAGTNTITGSASGTAQGYITNQAFQFIPANTNTGATTLNVNSLGAKNVFYNNAACVGGELVQNVPVIVVYDGTQFQVAGHATDFATNAETLTGTSTTLAVTPASLASVNGLVKLTSGTVSSASALAIVLTSYIATYNRFKIVLNNFLPATDGVGFFLRFSTNGGSVYDTGATDYGLANFILNSANTTGSLGEASTALILPSVTPIGNLAVEGIPNLVVELGNVNSTTQYTTALWDGVYVSSAGNITYIKGGGGRATAQDTDAIQFRFSSGNIASGTWALYGYK